MPAQADWKSRYSRVEYNVLSSCFSLRYRPPCLALRWVFKKHFYYWYIFLWKCLICYSNTVFTERKKWVSEYMKASKFPTILIFFLYYILSIYDRNERLLIEFSIRMLFLLTQHFILSSIEKYYKGKLSFRFFEYWDAFYNSKR